MRIEVSKTNALLLGFLLVLLGVAQIHAPINTVRAVSSDPASTGVLVPAYYDATQAAGQANFTALINAHNSYPSVPLEVVVNVYNGPGSSANSDFQSETSSMQSAGISVLGYVHTTYCQRALTDVEADINDWAQWYQSYGVSAIFFDEMPYPNDGYSSCSTGHSFSSYMQQITSYATTENFKYTIGNPGALDTNSSLTPTVRTINFFEHGYLPPVQGSGYTANATLAGVATGQSCNTNGTYGWHMCWEKHNFSFMSYGVSIPQPSTMRGYMDYVGFLFVSDRCGPGGQTPPNCSNPYYETPSYLSTELSDLSFSSVGITIAARDSNSPPNPINGIPVTFYQPTRNCSTYSDTCGEVYQGSSPLTLNATQNWQYVLQAPKTSGSCSFSMWSDGVTSNLRTVTAPTSAITYTAEYSGGSCSGSSPPPGSAVSVSSIDQNSNTITGFFTALAQNGITQKTGFTTVTFSNLNAGQTYTVNPQDYGSCTFSKWQDTGSSTNPRSFTAPTGSTLSLVAVYNCQTQSQLTVKSVDQNGNPLSGFYTILFQSGVVQQTGYTTVVFPSLNSGQSYTVQVQNYQYCSFSHWQDNNVVLSYRTFTAANSPTTFTAVYECDPNNLNSITVQTVDSNNVLITGYYTAFYDSGGTQLAYGYSTVIFDNSPYGLTANTNYEIGPQGYNGCNFNNWNGTTNTNNPLTVTAQSGENLLFDAIYSGSCP